MKYTVYQITNNVNGKIYIGKHQTKDINDGYMGSGKMLKRAIKKYGIENFTKDILHVFDTEEEMNEKEADLVTEEFCLRKDTYNLCIGGLGGFGYINQNALGSTEGRILGGMTQKPRVVKQFKDQSQSKSWHEKRVSTIIERHGRQAFATFTGKTHTEETKQKISKAKNGKGLGNENSQYGTMWITNGLSNKKINKTELIPEGWYKGRKINIGPIV